MEHLQRWSADAGRSAIFAEKDSKPAAMCDRHAPQIRWSGRPLTASMCQSGGVEAPLQEASMDEVSTVGIDLAKSVFQVSTPLNPMGR
ncbi:hypothetical protein, partial [Sphingomonas mali]|uniref:hypothetical protein n=1 Tax=Sphingomonas mali TaxID=40682 RepID=UPI001C3FD6F8